MEIFQGQFTGPQQTEPPDDKVVIQHSSESDEHVRRKPKIPIVKHENPDYLKMHSQKA
jgi:hypothetical protein